MSPPLPSLEIRNAATLATPLGRAARRGREQGEILRIHGAALRAENGLIVFAGSEASVPRTIRTVTVPLDRSFALASRR